MNSISDYYNSKWEKTPINNEKLINTLENILDQTDANKRFSKTLIDCINRNNFLIIGSFVHKLLTKSDYNPNDIDIVIESKFKKQMESNFSGTNTFIKSEYIYNYTCYIDSVYILKLIPQITFIYINTDYKTFLNKGIKFDFLRCYYTNNYLYKLNNQNLMKEDITVDKMLISIYKNVIKKYNRRGVKFNLIEQEKNKEYKIDNKLLNDFKNNYQQAGLVVIPLDNYDKSKEGKNPSIDNWLNLSKDYNFNIEKYNNCNLGIVCGKESGIMCIDVDQKDNGVKHFTKLIEKYKLPIGPYQTTPNGGFHYIFKYNESKMKKMKSKIKFFKFDNKNVGVEFWVNSVQFVVEPSVNRINGKKYKWEISIFDTPIPELPEWLYDLYESEEIDKNYNIKKKTQTIYEYLASWF